MTAWLLIFVFGGSPYLVHGIESESECLALYERMKPAGTWANWDRRSARCIPYKAAK